MMKSDRADLTEAANDLVADAYGRGQEAGLQEGYARAMADMQNEARLMREQGKTGFANRLVGLTMQLLMRARRPATEPQP